LPDKVFIFGNLGIVGIISHFVYKASIQNIHIMTKPFLSAFLLVIIAFGCANSDKISSQGTDRVQLVLDSLVTANELPGANFSVILSNQSMFHYSSGFAVMEKQQKMTSEHILFSGSIGKTYAVALLLQELEQGQISLDDKLISHFPDTPWLSRLPNMDKITIRMLLQHTSGLPEYVMQQATWDSIYTNPDKIWTYYDRMEIIFDMEPVHEPGKGWAYSDTNYILLGMLIEKLSQEAYYDLLSSRILIPEDLRFTFPSIRRDLEGIPQGYSKLPEMFRIPGRVLENGRYIFNPQMEWTGGGLVSSTSDLAIWARIYYCGTLFSDSLKQTIITPNKEGFNLGPGMSYGMGSFIYQTGFGPAYAHTGFVPGFNSIFAYYPELDVAVAFQTNCDYATRQMGLIDYLDLLVAASYSF
jgi:D-alanyl-D-alanine carboxypeptidase